MTIEGLRPDPEQLRVAERSLPQPDATSQPYWDGLGRGELLLQRCTRCRHFQFYPRETCEACAGDVEWTRASGRGEVHTFTVVRSNWVEPFKSLVPYILAVVQLAEGPRMLTNVLGCAPDEVTIGMPVELAPVPAGEVTLPFWVPATR